MKDDLVIIQVTKKKDSIYIFRVMSASAATSRNVAAPAKESTSGIKSSLVIPNISIVGVHA